MQAIDSTNYRIYYNKSRAYLQKEMFDEVLKNLDKYIALSPNRDDSYYDAIKERGFHNMCNANYTKAIKDFKIASLYDSKTKNAHNNVFDRYIYGCYVLLENNKRAEYYKEKLTSENDTCFIVFGVTHCYEDASDTTDIE